MELTEAKEMLTKHIEQFNIYDLERLKACFQYEYRIHPEKEACIREILDTISAEIEKRNSGG